MACTVVADFSSSMLLVRMDPTGLGGFAVKARLSEDQSQVKAIEERYVVSAENTYNTKYQDGESFTSWFQVHTGLDKGGAPIAFFSDPNESPTSSLNKVNNWDKLELLRWRTGICKLQYSLTLVSTVLYMVDSSLE